MRFKKMGIAACLLLVAGSSAQAQVYVGSFSVADGVAYQTGPISYSAQDAAVLLFGGTATDYAISTLGNNVATINHMEYADTYGFGVRTYAENYKLGPVYNYSGAVSAYVHDNSSQGQFVNYVFRVAPAVTPEPGNVALLIGLTTTGIGFFARRRKQSRHAA